MGRGDRWQESTFSNAVNDGKISQTEWDAIWKDYSKDKEEVNGNKQID
jgi:hypothetical protein